MITTLDNCLLILSANGVKLSFYKSRRMVQGRPMISWSSLKGAACRHALRVMGQAINESHGVFDPEKKHMLADIWTETARFAP